MKMHDLIRLAKLGAPARLQQLKDEMAAVQELIGETPKRGRRKMSAAARQAVSERMRKYWADRRKQQKKR